MSKSYFNLNVMYKKHFFLTVLLCSAVSALLNAKSPFETFSFVSKPASNSTNNEAVELKVTANVVTGATRYTIELNTNADFSGTSIVRTSTIDNQRTLVF